MSQVILVVNVKVKPEFSEDVYTYMKALHQLTHDFDKGCIQYDLHRVVDTTNEFCFIETWENQEALDEHMAKEHYKSFKAFVEDKVEDVQLTFLNKHEAITHSMDELKDIVS